MRGLSLSIHVGRRLPSLLALALIAAAPALAQNRAPWDACVFGDTQRVVDASEDPVFNTLTKVNAWSDSVDDCILNRDIAFHVGDWAQNQQGGAAGGVGEWAGVEWRRLRNIFLGPRLTYQVAGLNDLCTAAATPYACCTGLGTGTCDLNVVCTGAGAPAACCTGAEAGTCGQTDDVTAANTGTTAFLASTVPFLGARGNHESNTSSDTPWNYRTFNGVDWYSGSATTFIGDTTPRKYQRPDTYLNTFPDRDQDNHAFLVNLGGRRTLVLAIGCALTQVELDWALAQLSVRKHQPAIVVYHVGAASATPSVDRATDVSLVAGRTYHAQGGISCQAGDESEGALIPGGAAENLFALLVTPSTNVRMVFDGHYVDGFLSTSCIALDNPHGCCTGAGTGNCDANIEGAVSIAANGSTSVLEVVTNPQGFNNEVNTSGCVLTVTYSANTVQTDWVSPGSGVGCDGGTADADFDNQFPAAQALVFDPAPCNMFVTERAERTRTAFGCG